MRALLDGDRMKWHLVYSIIVEDCPKWKASNYDERYLWWAEQKHLCFCIFLYCVQTLDIPVIDHCFVSSALFGDAPQLH